MSNQISGRVIGTIAANGAAVTLQYTNRPAGIVGQQPWNGGLGVQVTGTFTGTLVVELTRDGTTFLAVQFFREGTGENAFSIVGTGSAVSVLARTELVGVVAARVRASAWTDGTANVTLVGVEG
jgi:hypothetical protein